MNQAAKKKVTSVTPYDPMTSKTMKNALKCCAGPKVSEVNSELTPEGGAICPGPSNPFANKQGGEADLDVKFRADVVEVEQFIPRIPFHYPEVPETKCPLGEPFADPCADKPLYINPETGEIVVDELASRHKFQYTPCFDSWKQSGYQRER